MTMLDQSFSTRQVPWAKIGTVIDDPSVTAHEAARLGGIDFDVELRPSGFWTAHAPALDDGTDDEEPQQLHDVQNTPLYLASDGTVTTDSGYWTHVPSRHAVVRKDDPRWFSFVSSEYRPVQFSEAFEFMDAISPRYVAAGALSDGRQGFVVVQLTEQPELDVRVGDEPDPHDMYVVLRTSHDLSKGVSVALMPLRNRCMNMFTLPTFNREVPQSWSIPHVGDPRAKLKQAQTVLSRASQYGDIFQRMVTQFSSVRITVDDLREIARRVLPDRLKTREAQVSAIVDRFENAQTVGYVGTGWGAINAVSDYQQWGRSTAARTSQSEFTSPLDGDTAKYVNRTAQLVLQRA